MKKEEKQAKTDRQKNKKTFFKENFSAFVALFAVLAVALYIIGTHLNLPVLIVPSNAVEITYPASIFNENTEDMAESMRGSEGIYRVKINEDGSLSAKMSPERYEKIVEAADNAVNSMTIISIGEETAVKDYSAEKDHTVLKITVDKNVETLEKEVDDAIYTVRLYHACKKNNDVKIDAYYIDNSTGECYMRETYDINGNVVGKDTGSIAMPESDAN